ncbi:MAG: phosphatidate cytidylyltransferase [Gammaproteobacteria bacterium]|nr:MAG: phosphatidate cytidylyltransferase [Pseudomonadota bacterium]PIE39002.1 MAG: phosphatidate cytidylyltransferase [Gammaproteobacteria bacterium]
MLKQRIITALILAPVVLGGIFLLEPLYFSWFIALIIALAGWEWANLSHFTGQARRWGYAAFILVLLFLSSCIHPGIVFTIAVIWWLVAFFLVVHYPEKTDLWTAPAARLVMGVLVLVPAWQALVFIRSSTVTVGDNPGNLWVIVYVMFLVWGADIGAYFAGRAFGKRKLAPRVSPGKSWAGVYGGLAVIELIALGSAYAIGLSLSQTVLLLLITLVTGIVSVLGDLLESMIKRYRGIKDSSQLLPGHGGVMDRVDSLTAALPVFCFCLILIGWLE